MCSKGNVCIYIIIICVSADIYKLPIVRQQIESNIKCNNYYCLI